LKFRYIRHLLGGDWEHDPGDWVRRVAADFTGAFPDFGPGQKAGLRDTVLQACGTAFEPFFEPPAEEKKPSSVSAEKPSTEGDRETSFPKAGLLLPHAGLVLCWPYLHRLFDVVDVLDGHGFKSEEAQLVAIFLLHYLASGSTEAEEHRLTVPKILTGTDPGKPLPMTMEIPRGTLAECEQVLHAMIRNWTALKATSPEGLRTVFLQRPALIRRNDRGWDFRFERKTVDVLMDRLPFALGLVKLTWMNQPIYVSW
jgi:hypothetical protein